MSHFNSAITHPACITAPTQTIPARSTIRIIPNNNSIKDRERNHKLKSIYCDGTFGSHCKPYGWATVTDEKGRDLLEEKFLSERMGRYTNNATVKTVKCKKDTRIVGEIKHNEVTMQNNSAELLAMIIALDMANNDPNIEKIYCDSKLIVEYWSKGIISKDMRRTSSADKLSMIEICKTLRDKFQGEVLWISGDKNPADFGYH